MERKGRPTTVLHVDDDEGLRRLVGEIFDEEAPNLDYVPAATPEEAMEALDEIDPPVMLLMDRRLPGLDLWAFVEQVETKLDLVAVPVFILSGSKEPKTVAEAYANGAGAYIEKPMDPDGFARIAHSLERYADIVTFPGRL
jgi:DNA-binding NtrC family response regulator